MPSTSSRREYTRRMNRVLDHIDQHLDAPLELAILAGLAHFSPFHFHRLFGAWMDETLGAYLQRRRLERGAQALVLHPELSVLAIALAVGFGSGEAFARAFHKHFDCTPSAWRAGSTERWARYLQAQRAQLRQERKFDQDGAGEGAEDEDLSHPHFEFIMQVEIKQFPPQRVAYLRYIGPYGPGIGAFWQQRVGPWLEAEGLLGRPSYGIAHDDPSITAPERCRYDAAVGVGPDFQPAARPASPNCRADAMRWPALSAGPTRSARPGPSCSANGCRPAA
jgi:AraC family transcriptional regulator